MCSVLVPKSRTADERANKRCGAVRNSENQCSRRMPRRLPARSAILDIKRVYLSVATEGRPIGVTTDPHHHSVNSGGVDPQPLFCAIGS